MWKRIYALFVARNLEFIRDRSALAWNLLLPVLIGATWAHAANGWLFSNEHGGWEYPLLLTVVALVQALLGDGAYSAGALLARRHQTPRAGLAAT